jgi:TusA-related sulfurtransferase
MEHLCAGKSINLDLTFCPPAAVVTSSLKKAESGEVLLVKASRCQVEMVEAIAERLGAEIIQKEKKGSATELWIIKK